MMPRAGLSSRGPAILFLLCLLAAAEPFAQNLSQIRFDHRIGGENQEGNFPSPDTRARAVPDTLRLLAVMVEFLPDNDARTSGNGTFDLSEPLVRMKDPPPHDRGYFDVHLAFLKNYYAKVSGGLLEIEPSLLPGVYRLPVPMRDYSPPKNSADNAELGRLVADTWRLVDSTTPGTEFERFDAFVIFHAGVGRDIDLVSIYGYDPTPFDIPSLYLNIVSMKKIFGDGYEGVPVRGGAFAITNTMIIPETESRTVPVIGGNVLLELGINGLLAANAGSHLGLPDLFDTRTGRSGIGRFGLMDGQSIFSWGGFIPPEPSAWEKYFLGWVDPITVDAGSAVRELPAVGTPGPPDTVYRVPVSAGEYFLVENRNRDAMGDGQTVSMVWAGDTLVRTWARDTAGFTFVDQDSLYGVLLDVDDFDWSLPGGVNSRTGEWYDGGVLVWHVDESVIGANYASGTVNADPERRGVDLEEADGSQDIGRSYGFISAGSGSEDGTVLDFWYAGNQAPLRVESNLFGPNSNPHSLGNYLTNSHATVSEFSARGPRMSARFTLGDSVVSPIAGFPKSAASAFTSGAVMATDWGALVAVSSGPSPRAYGWTMAGGPVLPGSDTSGLLPLPGAAYTLDSLVPRAAVGLLDDDFYYDIVLAGSVSGGGRLAAAELHDADGDLLADSLFEITLPHAVTTAPVIADSFIAVGTTKGFVYIIDRDGRNLREFHIFPDDSSDVVSLALLGNDGGLLAGSAGGEMGSVLAPACIVPLYASGSVPFYQGPVHVASGRFSTGPGAPALFTFVGVSGDGTVSVGDICGENLPGFPYSAGGAIRNQPAIADIDGDGMMDIIVLAGRKVLALNQAGSPLDGFPVAVATGSDLAGSPVVADIDGDGSPDVAGVTAEGIVFAFRRDGAMLGGFPLQAGPNDGVTPAAFYTQSGCLSCTDIGLAVATGDGSLYAWKTGELITGPMPPPVQPWPQFARDSRNTASEDTVLVHTPPSGGFLPASRTYNWPNPVGRADGYVTHIRYYVPSDARVTVRIFDLAGSLVRSFEGLNAQGGLDNEVDWDVSGVESGVYFAQVEADGQSGSGSAVITIAVVK
ncbi:MAG TPA: FG-GAP-like repeat-containing protein [Bacteroidota bacterium]|nr:FG-GAP-like repeat-containing protein [Bacteroidota bacterium]